MCRVEYRKTGAGDGSGGRLARLGALLLVTAALALPGGTAAHAQAEDWPPRSWSEPAKKPPKKSTAPARKSTTTDAKSTGADTKAPAPAKASRASPKAGAAAAGSAFPPPPPDPALAGVKLDPAWPKQLYVLGNSVMLGVKRSLLAGLPDWQINFTARPALMIRKAIEELRQSQAPLGSVAVIALGYNSLWQKQRQNFQRWSNAFDKDVEDMLALLKSRGVRKVVWVLLRELTPELAQLAPQQRVSQRQFELYAWYFPYVNERLREIKKRHPELALADWATAARRTGVTYDAIHTTPAGSELYVDVVRIAIGVGARPPRSPDPAGAVKKAAPQPRTEPEPPPSSQPKAPKPPQVRPVVTASTSVHANRKPGDVFRDCSACPEMVVLPAGSFVMGSPKAEPDRGPEEGPQHKVTVARPFAVGKFEVTFAEWEACAADGGCKSNANPGDEGWGRGRQPVINVSWDDAKEYLAWLSRTTGKTYRLLTEAEWEYAARAGTTSPFSTGATITTEQANFNGTETADGRRDGKFLERAVEVGTYAANPWGLHEMHGNVWEWVEDNWHDDYKGAPSHGGAWRGGDATMRVLRGGSWYKVGLDLRSASRFRDLPDYRSADVGFRVARGL